MRAASKVLGTRSEPALLREQELGKILKPWSMDRVISWKPRWKYQDSRLGPDQHKCELMA